MELTVYTVKDISFLPVVGTCDAEEKLFTLGSLNKLDVESSMDWTNSWIMSVLAVK